PSANLLRASFYRHGTVSLVDIGVLIFWIFLTQLLILGTLQKEL
ncbi:ABC transporter permease, partial [Lactobacillus reuteri]|nr:ABC transporter permease [Limosilactobacillus reuteri]